MCVLVLTFLLVFTHASARSPHCCAADGVLAWRRPCLARVIDRCQKGHAHCKRAGVYQFGVFTGQSMRGVSLALAQSNVSYGAMYGFDSFDGLPDIEGGSAFAACSGGVCGWRRGAYNATDAAKTCGCLSQGFTEGVSLPKRLAKYIGDARIVWVPGWFDASLTDALARRLAPALYVDIDTDLYSSAATALNWLFFTRSCAARQCDRLRRLGDGWQKRRAACPPRGGAFVPCIFPTSRWQQSEAAMLRGHLDRGVST